MDYIRAEIARSNELKGKKDLTIYSQSISPAYIIKKGDRTLDQLALDSIKENRFQFHRFLEDKKFLNLIDPDVWNLNASLLALAFVVGICVLMMICTAMRQLLIRAVKKNVSKRINEISQELLILLIVAALLKMVDYYRVMPFKVVIVIVNDVQLLLSEFAICYIMVNAIGILHAQLNITAWLKYETLVPERVALFREFERLYVESSEGTLEKELQGKYAQLRKVIKFMALRQEFMSPTFVPLLRDNVLRDDFRFADYLGKAYYKTMEQVIAIRPFSLLSFLFMFGVYLFIRLVFSEQFEIYAMLVLAVLIFGLMTAFLISSTNIFYRLSQPLKTPYELTIQPFDAVRNPYANLDKIYTPYYLRNNFESSVLKDKRIINCHESLFMFGSPLLMLRLMHFSVIVQIVWGIIFFSNYMFELDSALKIIVCVVSSLLILINLCYLLPTTLRNMALATNVTTPNKDRDDEGPKTD